MASRSAFVLSSMLLLGVGALALGSTDATAGQFKTLNTAGLGSGGQVTAYSSPKNTGQAMEMEVYEWQTASTGGSYQCNIINNFTGRSLNVRLIGVSGTQITSCTAAANSTCTMPPVSLSGNLKFQCLVATQFGAPIASDASWYRIAVRRAN